MKRDRAPSTTTITNYNKIKNIKDHVYDISSANSDHPHAKKMKAELEHTYNVRMGTKEYEYIENQLTSTIGKNYTNKIQ